MMFEMMMEPDDPEFDLQMMAAEGAFFHLLCDMGEREDIAAAKAQAMIEMLDDEIKIMEGIRNN